MCSCLALIMLVAASAHAGPGLAESSGTAMTWASPPGDTTDLWKHVDILVNGGVNIPLTPHRFNSLSPDFTVGAGIAFWESRKLAIVIAANYAQYSSTRSTLYVSGGGRVSLTTGAVRPYLEGGLGYFRLKSRGDKKAVGIHGELGAQVSIVFLLAQYVLGFTEHEYTSYVSIRAGLAIKIAG